MRAALLLGLLVSAACETVDDPPAGAPPGPGGGGSAGRVDAGAGGDGGVPSAITGRLCVPSDWRPGGACPTLALAGATVTVVETDAQATTDAQGRFTLPAAPGYEAVTLLGRAGGHVGGAVVVGLDGGGTSGAVVPLTRLADFEDTLVLSNQTVVAGDGVVVVAPFVDGKLAAGLEFGALDGIPPAYATDQAQVWSVAGPDGPAGVAYFGVTPGLAVEGTVTVSGSVQTFVTPVIADAVVFVAYTF